MSRRKAPKQDSLELLLDTICNTFGGVLFIAILVVMLLQQTGMDVASTPLDEIPPEQLHDLESELSELTENLNRLKTIRASQISIVDQFSTEEVRGLFQQEQQLASVEAQLQRTISDLLAKNVGSLRRVETSRNENSKVKQDLAAALSARRQAQIDLDSSQKSRTIEARLPLIRSSGRKSEIGVVLQFGRLYLWHQYDQFQNRIGLNTDDFVVVGEEGGSLVTRPKPTGGIVLNSSPASKDSIRRLLHRFDPTRCYFVAVVRPDSFGVFGQFRDIALELGFNYRLMPVEVDSSIFDRGGTSDGVQ